LTNTGKCNQANKYTCNH